MYMTGILSINRMTVNEPTHWSGELVINHQTTFSCWFSATTCVTCYRVCVPVNTSMRERDRKRKAEQLCAQEISIKTRTKSI